MWGLRFYRLRLLQIIAKFLSVSYDKKFEVVQSARLLTITQSKLVLV